MKITVAQHEKNPEYIVDNIIKLIGFCLICMDLKEKITIWNNKLRVQTKNGATKMLTKVVT